MKRFLKYRDNSYFNDKDYFLFMNSSGQFYLTDLELHNNNWYPKEYKTLHNGMLYPSGFYYQCRYWYNRGCLQVKMTTILSVNYNELVGLTMRYKDTNLVGNLSKRCVLNNFGVNWSPQLTHQDYKQWGFPTSWADPNDVEIL